MKLVQAYRATERYEQSANTAAIVNAKYQSVYRLFLVARLQRFDELVAVAIAVVMVVLVMVVVLLLVVVKVRGPGGLSSLLHFEPL